ncbi:MAG: MBOAT family protein [bacterium]|nr:MBOAT family protein [bacterium]
MLFNSFSFLIFFPAVTLVYFIIPRKIRYIWLLFASYFFYMCWNAKYVALIATSTLITWVCGILLGKTKKARIKKLIVAGGAVSNLLILFFFKYFDFFLENINSLLRLFHISAVDNPFSFLLPVGISFYTFQALGYLIDVYREDTEPEKNLLRYALFVSFFPQLVAGPVERSGRLLKQLRETDKMKLWNYDRIASGFTMMAWGLFQKMVIADRLSVFVDEIFANVYACGTVETVLGAIGFSFQIYCDFAGYSAVAVGAARVMGFELTDNFDAPYFAVSIGDFWHRWHISLSTWFRDYVYIPLGGNRSGRGKKYRNLMITFLASGLWHGANWTYVIWGGLHGLYQIAGDVWKPVREKITEKGKVKTEAVSYRFGRIAVTFCLTAFAWIFFRAATLQDAFYYLQRMFTGWNPWVLFDQSLYSWGLDVVEFHILAVAMAALLAVDLIKYRKREDLGTFLRKQNLWFAWGVIILLVVGTAVYGEYGVNFDSKQFIYFAF